MPPSLSEGRGLFDSKTHTPSSSSVHAWYEINHGPFPIAIGYVHSGRTGNRHRWKNSAATLPSVSVSLYGSVAEWLKALVLKAGVPKGTVGSNPTASSLPLET